MGKKRRQHNTNVDGSEESTESGEGGTDTCTCKHIKKVVENHLQKFVNTRKIADQCCNCQKNGNNDDDNETDEISNKPPRLFICLHCGVASCGTEDKNHAKSHFDTSRSGTHYLVMDTKEWTIWCYECNETVTNCGASIQLKIDRITSLLKKYVSGNKEMLSKSMQPKSCISLCQNEKSNNEEKRKLLNDLPKVGGLMNLGNTCFFNAVLQCLAQTPYLIKVLDDLQVPDQKFILPGGKHKINDDEEVDLPPIEGTLEKNCSFISILRRTLSEMQNSDGRVFKPIELLESLKEKKIQCTDGGQHDSHELLRHLLDLVRNENLKGYQRVILNEVGLSVKSNPQRVADNLKSRVKLYGNQANAKLLGAERVFRGELVSTLECLECHHTSSRSEPFLDLSLPISIDKSLPPIVKRKSNNFENSFDFMGNISPPKYDAKKEIAIKELGKKNRRKHSSNNTRLKYNDSKTKNVTGSVESDADIEDNTENDDSSVLEIGESGYSSEKPSAVTSPVHLDEWPQGEWSNSPALTERICSNYFANNVRASRSPQDRDVSSCSFDFTQETKLGMPNSTDDPKNDLEEITSKENNNITSTLSLSNSIIFDSEVVSLEEPTVSPLSSPPSKDSLTSPISSAVDGEDTDIMNKLALEINNTNKSPTENCQKEQVVNLSEENSPTSEVNNTTKKLTNGISDITTSMTKLNVSSPIESPTRYQTKEGECSIQLCLNQFAEVELMNKNNKVSCTSCTERANKGKKENAKMVFTDSTKQYLISRVPAVLILHLKRFQMQKFGFRKVGKHVSFPILLDLAPVCKDYTKPVVYALYGVVVHHGNLYGGHYIAYVKSRTPLEPNDPRWSFLPTSDSFESNGTPNEPVNSELENDENSGAATPQIKAPPGRWYYVSDSSVHEAEEETVLKSEAYLLFYERIL